MYVKPVAGRVCPDPYQGDNVPEAGRDVEANQYWFRRVADGDVVETDKPAQVDDAATKSAKKGA
jgi:hypothetical protein